MYRFSQGALALNFSILRSKKRRKTISIEINRQKQVALRAPFRASDAQILAVVQQRWQWIFTKLAAIEAMIPPTEPVPWYQAKQIFYLGQAYPVQEEYFPIPKTRAGCEFSGTVFMLSLSQLVDQAALEALRLKILSAWYTQEAKSYLLERTHYFSKCMQVLPQKIIIKTQKRRWGSCDAANNIRYNWKVMMAAPELIDYLVVHELAHIRYKNHGQDFWNFVGTILPDYQSRRQALRDFGRHIE